MEDCPGPVVRQRSRPNGRTCTEWQPAPSTVTLPAKPQRTLMRVMVLSGDWGSVAEAWLASTPQGSQVVLEKPRRASDSWLTTRPPPSSHLWKEVVRRDSAS